MTTLTLGKVKLVNRGTWSSSATYTQGDVVQYNGVSFIYHNETPKAYTSLFFGTLSSFPLLGTIASLPANSTQFTITWTTALPSTADSRIVPNSTIFAYTKYFDSDALITSITHTNTTTSVITVNCQSNNTSTVTSVPVSIGPRRVGNRYEVSFNEIDWDLMSDNMTFVGDWNISTSYLPGQIVTRNNQSYQCVNGVVGIDPLWDYVGAWDPFLVGNEALPHERVLTTPNTNPWGWRGHPFVPNPTWGTANTYAGIPWNLPTSHKNSYFAGRWNSTQNRTFMDYRGTSSHWSDAQGNEITRGNCYYYWGVGGAGDVRLYAGETGPKFELDYYTNESPNYGNTPFAKSKSTPRCMQSGHAWANKAVLMSNGSLMMGGENGNGKCGVGETSNPDLPLIQLRRSSFSNRSIVKVAQGAWGGRDGSSHTLALDEHGELWAWGYNGHGQCGNGKETGGDTGMRAGTDVDIYSPLCLTKEIYFGGNRIVDIACGSYSSYALDETGQLWSWGYNNYGQLGYPTNTGTGSSDRCRYPRVIPVSWAGYGGIQKFAMSNQEGADWLTVLDGQGHIWNCGYNNQGQLGRNNTTNDSNASTITRTSSTLAWSIGGGIKNFFVGHNNNPTTYFLDTSLNLWATGCNSHKNLHSDGVDRLVPVQLYGPAGAVPDIVTIVNTGRAGGGSQHFLDVNGVAYGTGWNGYGECGFGTTDYGGSGNVRTQSFGQSSTSSIQRVLLPNAWQKDIVDLWGHGDYDATSSHITLAGFINSRGEMLQAGRDYNYTTMDNTGHAYCPQTIMNFF
jgi:alpha-tubulin suppressor-like RCC1 family protein